MNHHSASSSLNAPRIERGTSAYWRTSAALFLAGFATFSLLYCVQPLLPLFAHDFSLSPAASSLALSLSTGFLAVAIVCAVPLSEKIGRRGLMFGSMTSAALLNIAVIFLPDWHWLLGTRALEGFVLGGVPAVAMTYLAEEINSRELGLVMGLYVAGTAFGGMIGRVGAGLLSQAYSWHVALLIIGVMGLIAALGFIALLPRARHSFRHSSSLTSHAQAWGSHLRHVMMLRIDGIGFLIMGTFVVIYNYTGFRLLQAPYNLTQSELGLIFTVYLCGMIASFVAGSLSDTMGRSVVMRLGLIVAAIGVALTLSSGLVTIIFGIIFVTIGFFSVHSVASSSVSTLAEQAKGYASSLYLLAYYLGSSTLGSIGGWFYRQGGWSSIVLFTFVLLTLAYGIVPRFPPIQEKAPRRPI